MKTLNYFSKFFVLSLFVLFFSNCTERIEKFEVVPTGALFDNKSELFGLLNKVAAKGDNPTEVIVCIDFIYPFTLIVYDENLEQIDVKSFYSDVSFSDFLGQLPDGESISLSYPIATTLADGTVFSINNNDELKIVIDSCSREDIISYCSDLFSENSGDTKCYWKVPFTKNGNNKYASGVFESYNNGTLNFNYNNVDYAGTWVFLFFNDEFQININLQGTSEVALDWNFSKKAVFENGKITINNGDFETILVKKCETGTDYLVGDIGPAGGFVFYDKGSYSKGWRYLEAAPADLGFAEWGCKGSFFADANAADIGFGFINTVSIVNFHDALQNYDTNPAICNPLNNGTVAAEKAVLYELNGFKDWFLPSEKELNLMYQNLHTTNIAEFSDSQYWTATQIDANNVITIDFLDGTVHQTEKIPAANSVNARAIRAF